MKFAFWTELTDEHEGMTAQAILDEEGVEFDYDAGERLALFYDHDFQNMGAIDPDSTIDPEDRVLAIIQLDEDLLEDIEDEGGEEPAETAPMGESETGNETPE